MIKMPKVNYKGRILKKARERQLLNYKGTPIRILADFSMEILQAGMDWHAIVSYEMLTAANKTTLPRRLSIKIEGEIKSFPDRKKLKEFITAKPVLQEMLKGLL